MVLRCDLRCKTAVLDGTLVALDQGPDFYALWQRELTGKRRNRLFVYEQYLAILNEGPNPREVRPADPEPFPVFGVGRGQNGIIREACLSPQGLSIAGRSRHLSAFA